MTGKPTTVRLDRLLANLGYGSRRDINRLAEAGRITLDGKPLLDSSERLALSPDLQERLHIAEAPVDPLPGVVLMLNKPAGVTCSHKEAGPLVYSLLPERWRRRDPAISTVGRLDKESSGLLLLTDDGTLLHRIISPRSVIAKRYRAGLARALQGNEGELFASGTLMLEGEDKPLAPAILEPISTASAYVTVTEGRYHQVRRMLAAAGNHVEVLHRDRIGGLELPADLAPGAWRIMSASDISAIFAQA